MENIHSIIIIKKGDKFLNYYDKRWKMYLFPNIKGNDIEKIKEIYKTDDVKLLFDKTHDKYSVSHKKIRIYHHYFYEVKSNIKINDSKYFFLDELLKMEKENKYNSDIIKLIEDYYKNNK